MNGLIEDIKQGDRAAFREYKLPAEFYGTRTGKDQSASCMPAKTDPADPSDLYPAALFI